MICPECGLRVPAFRCGECGWTAAEEVAGDARAAAAEEGAERRALFDLAAHERALSFSRWLDEAVDRADAGEDVKPPPDRVDATVERRAERARVQNRKRAHRKRWSPERQKVEKEAARRRRAALRKEEAMRKQIEYAEAEALARRVMRDEVVPEPALVVAALERWRDHFARLVEARVTGAEGTASLFRIAADRLTRRMIRDAGAPGGGYPESAGAESPPSA